MESSPRISVIVPVYNQAQFLRETIASVEGQTWPAVETIWVDDGSTDGSGAMLDEMVGGHDKVIHRVNGGLPAARVTDQCTCTGPPDIIAKGEPTVLIGS